MFFGYLIALLHTLGSIAAVHAVLTVRTAQGSIAWALSLLFIPYLTLIPYLVFRAQHFLMATSRRADKPTKRCARRSPS
nr:hypothetical protein GCM10020185_33990 [Pseudomonas brassicacearum subsp. brassicacearum]